MIYSSSGPAVVESYEPAPISRQLGIDTKQIIVPFSSKGVNHGAYLALVDTVVWCALLVYLTVVPSFSDNRRFNYPPQFEARQEPHPLIPRRAVRRRHYRPRIKSQ